MLLKLTKEDVRKAKRSFLLTHLFYLSKSFLHIESETDFYAQDMKIKKGSKWLIGSHREIVSSFDPVQVIYPKMRGALHLRHKTDSPTTTR